MNHEDENSFCISPILYGDIARNRGIPFTTIWLMAKHKWPDITHEELSFVPVMKPTNYESIPYLLEICVTRIKK